MNTQRYNNIFETKEGKSTYTNRPSRDESNDNSLTYMQVGIIIYFKHSVSLFCKSPVDVDCWIIYYS